MDSFRITHTLTLGKDPRGALVHYTASSGTEADVFAVGLNPRSLKACQKCLTRTTASWETGDGSLRVIKHEAEVTLVFKMQGPPFETREITLTGDALSRFEEAIAHLAASEGS